MDYGLLPKPSSRMILRLIFFPVVSRVLSCSRPMLKARLSCLSLRTCFMQVHVVKQLGVQGEPWLLHRVNLATRSGGLLPLIASNSLHPGYLQINHYPSILVQVPRIHFISIFSSPYLTLQSCCFIHDFQPLSDLIFFIFMLLLYFSPSKMFHRT
jgi:hypothetical protein